MTIDLSTIPSLSAGKHAPMSAEMCVMEAAAYIAREPWSDHPQCVSTTVATFLRPWNDALSDERRNELLRPLIPHLIGTRGNEDLERRRALMAIDWLLRHCTPAWLRLAGLTAQADALDSFPEITDFGQYLALTPILNAVEKDAAAARAAARDMAWDAALDAASHAARDAASLASWTAAGVAVDATAVNASQDAAQDAAQDEEQDEAWAAAMGTARATAMGAAWLTALAAAGPAASHAAQAAARATARAAARTAARDAARDALAPTIANLQQSALALVNRMIDARAGEVR